MNKSIFNLIFIAVFSISTNLVAEENLFEKNYVIQSPEGFKSFQQTPDTKIMRGWDKDTDNVMMLENGYDFMGFSGFVLLFCSWGLGLESDLGSEADSWILLWVLGCLVAVDVLY